MVGWSQVWLAVRRGGTGSDERRIETEGIPPRGKERGKGESCSRDRRGGGGRGGKVGLGNQGGGFVAFDSRAVSVRGEGGRGEGGGGRGRGGRRGRGKERMVASERSGRREEGDGRHGFYLSCLITRKRNSERERERGEGVCCRVEM